MFSINEYVVYKNTSVCEIVDVEEVEQNGATKQYYILTPLYHNVGMRVKVPVDNCRQIRKIVSKNDAINIIDDMPKSEDIWINDNRLRKESFSKVVTEGTLADLCCMLHTLNQKNEEYLKKHKTLPMTDKMYYESSERLVLEEIATVFNIGITESLNYIKNRLDRSC